MEKTPHGAEKQSLVRLENRCLKKNESNAGENRRGMKKKTDPFCCPQLTGGSSALHEWGRDSHPRDPG